LFHLFVHLFVHVAERAAHGDDVVMARRKRKLVDARRTNHYKIVRVCTASDSTDSAGAPPATLHQPQKERLSFKLIQLIHAPH
jgi:hypothetical protein